MRCLALDAVATIFQRFLSTAESVAFKARQDEGKSAANKLAKMYWFLQACGVWGRLGGGGQDVLVPTGMSGVGQPGG